MKPKTLAVAFSTLLAPAAPLLSPALAQDATDPDGATPAAVGSATALVLHPLTGEGLAGMPVVVRRVIDPSDALDATLEAITGSVFMTDEFGRALLFPLPDGVYDAYVDFNLHQSNVERFVILADTDFHPVVTLLFNPDIDR
jgi:hypothetical protein